MMSVVESPLFLATALFTLGLLGFLVRRNLLFLFLAIEIMLLASAYAFITLSSSLGDVDGQVMFLMILAVAAAELCVGLAIIIRFDERNKSLSADSADHLKG